jgi:hypothetical protein
VGLVRGGCGSCRPLSQGPGIMSICGPEGHHQCGTPRWTVNVPHQQFGGGAICWVPPRSCFLPLLLLLSALVCGGGGGGEG